MITVHSGVLHQGKVELVQVQVAVYKRAFPQLIITGLPSQVVRESKERVITAFRELGIRLPRGRYVVHLQPATIKKEGTWLDGAIWLALYLSTLSASSRERQKSFFVVGELGLDGSFTAPAGTLNILHSAFKTPLFGRDTRFIFPKKVLSVPYTWPSTRVLLPTETLDGLKKATKTEECWTGGVSTELHPIESSVPIELLISPQMLRACEISLGGKHSMLLFGSPGQGKTHISSLLRHLLPPCTPSEEQTLSLQLDSGFVGPERVVFLSHTDSRLRTWSEYTASRVFLLDELPLWDAQSRQFLHAWLEIGDSEDVSPAHVVATANPCPCGFYGEDRCRCTSYERSRYVKKFSGPLLDRLCLQVRVRKDDQKLHSYKAIHESVQRIQGARQRQIDRSVVLKWPECSRLYSFERMLETMSVPAILQEVMESWSLRRQTHFLQVAYTLCDLEGVSEFPMETHLWESLEFVKPTQELG